MIYWQLFFEFFKTGLFSIGGGLATIPFLKEIALNYNWYSASELTDMLAVSESTPGAIGVNMATYAGFQAAGPIGAAIATFGLVLPSIIVIILISRILSQFRTSKYVQRGFYGLRPASAGLVLGAMAGIFLSVFFCLPLSAGVIQFLGSLNLKAVVLFAVILFGLHKFPKLHPIAFIAVGAVVGVIFKF